jgi:hypothetical protein
MAQSVLSNVFSPLVVRWHHQGRQQVGANKNAGTKCRHSFAISIIYFVPDQPALILVSWKFKRYAF